VDIRFGLISSDSHSQVDKDSFLNRMSACGLFEPTAISNSRDFIERCFNGVPENERKQILWENAVKLYKI